MQIENAWYRVSIKALIYNEDGKILLCREKNGVWDLPGGGLDHGEGIFTSLKRELDEEMGLQVVHVEERPECFVVFNKKESKSRPWIANACYRVVVKNLNFRISDECEEIAFFDGSDVKAINAIGNVYEVFKEVFRNK